MPRKGWSSLEKPAGWYQVIRGPRPKEAQGSSGVPLLHGGSVVGSGLFLSR